MPPISLYRILIRADSQQQINDITHASAEAVQVVSQLDVAKVFETVFDTCKDTIHLSLTGTNIIGNEGAGTDGGDDDCKTCGPSKSSV